MHHQLNFASCRQALLMLTLKATNWLPESPQLTGFCPGSLEGLKFQPRKLRQYDSPQTPLTPGLRYSSLGWPIRYLFSCNI